MRNVSDKGRRENQHTNFIFKNFFFSKTVPFMRKCKTISYSRARHRWQNGARTLYVGYLQLQTHNQNM